MVTSVTTLEPADDPEVVPLHRGPSFGCVPARAARDRELTGTMLRVLIAICARAGKDRQAWVTLPTLHLDTGLDPRNIAREIGKLERLGYLKRIGWELLSAGRRARRYLVLLDDPTPYPDMTSYPGMTSYKTAPEVIPGYDRTDPLEQTHTDCDRARGDEPVFELTPGQGTTGRKPRRSPRQAKAPDDADQAAEMWNALAKQCDLPAITKLDGRRAKLHDRLKECGGLDGFREALGKVAASSFLTGKVPGRDGAPPFRASLDFIIKPVNFTRLMEGNYDDRRGPNNGAAGAPRPGPQTNSGGLAAVRRVFDAVRQKENDDA